MKNADTCKVCRSATSFIGKYEMIGRYQVSWFRCKACGFTQTEEPFWLEEAYKRPINKSDVGAVNRNITNALLTGTIITLFFDAAGTFVDYGGGYGLFARMMRDKGFDFYRYDKYCENIFAEGFDSDESPRTCFELATAFEVFEHFVDPLVDIDRILELSSSVLFSTTLIPETSPSPAQWWYYGLEHGQHIALYTERSLRSFAESKGLKFYSNGQNYHLFTKQTLPSFSFKFACNLGFGRLISAFIKRKSLISPDYNKVAGRKLC